MLSLLVSTSICSLCRSFGRLFVRAYVRSFFPSFFRSLARSFVRSLIRSFARSFVSRSHGDLVWLVVFLLVHSFARSLNTLAHTFNHLSIRLHAVSGDTFSSVANAVLEDLTMNALLTARVIGHRNGLPCLELYLVQGQQVCERIHLE